MKKLEKGGLVRIITPLAERVMFVNHIITTADDKLVGGRGEIVEVNGKKIKFNANGNIYTTDYTGWQLRKITNMERGATFSDDRKYRYKLYRIWDIRKPYAIFVGLNPSKGDEKNDSRTIKKVMDIARLNGYGGIIMINLFGLVSPDPTKLIKHPDVMGENLLFLMEMARTKNDVIFCWGYLPSGGLKPYLFNTRLFPIAHCLGINKDGSPKHPLFLKSDTKIIRYERTF